MAHQERAHALLAPSSATRWLNCPPSARLEDAEPEQPSSSFAEEGTAAHELAETELRFKFNFIDFTEYKNQMVDRASSPYFDASMMEHVAMYVDYIVDLVKSASKTCEPTLLIEEKINLTAFVPEGFGSNDFIILADDTLHIIDLKYGKGVKVSAQENAQLKLYALGAYTKHQLSYDITKISMTIVQPRLEWIDTFEMYTDDLVRWGIDVVKPKAKIAFEGKGDTKAGEHCRFCRVAATCRTLAKYNQQLAKMEFRDPNLLSDEELIEVLQHSAMLVNWVEKAKAHLLSKAVSGHKFKDYKLVAGRSQRKITDEDKVVQEVFTMFKYDESQYMNKKLKGITDLEKLLGKKEFQKHLGKFIEKPLGKPMLAPEDDPRPAYFKDAQADFNDSNE